MNHQQVFNSTFRALLKEAQFTRELLGSGATQIGKAHYAAKGVCFQTFTGLSTGVERIGKLCLMLDHYVDHRGTFLDSTYMSRKINHNIDAILEKSQQMISKYPVSMKFLSNLNGPIHQAIQSILCAFALGDRYSNINLLVGDSRQNDPIAAWFQRVDRPLFETHIPKKKKEVILRNAKIVGLLYATHTRVRYISEVEKEMR